MPVQERECRETVKFTRDILNALPSILQVIEHGYVLLFTSERTKFNGKNQVLALENM